MKKIPVISGEELIRALRRYGFLVDRQRGSHVRLKFKSIERTVKLTVPLHNPLKKGTLRRILKEAGIGVEELRDLLNK